MPFRGAKGDYGLAPGHVTRHTRQLNHAGKMAENRQGFSHREADEKSLLDEAFRRGMGERRRANGDLWRRSGRFDQSRPAK